MSKLSSELFMNAVYKPLSEQETLATTFAQTTYTRAVSSMAARARSGWAEAPLSGGIGHLAGTETTESDARVK